MNTTGGATSTDDISPTDDSCSTCSCTGDSGFSDSREFLKEPPPSSPQHTPPAQREHGSNLRAPYTPLIAADVRIPGYYTTLNRDGVEGTWALLASVIHYSHDNYYKVYYHIIQM